MLTSGDIGGVMAMMPAFANDEAGTLSAKATVDVARLRDGVDRIICDGIDVLATTGSFGECHTLLADEFRTLANETAAIVSQRLPLFIGVTSANAREVVAKMAVVQNTKADGVLLGVPYYLPSSLDNAVRFVKEIAELYPRLAILLYHNPTLHHVRFPTGAFNELARLPNLIGMKDSHRSDAEFLELQKIVAGKISMFVYQGQYCRYAPMGAAGLWSIDAWMGPWPLLALRDAVKRQDYESAAAITAEVQATLKGPGDMIWRENARKISIQLAGYVNPGPLRPPFLTIPADVIAEQTERARAWRILCDKHRVVPSAA